jgi:hypothetical protein
MFDLCKLIVGTVIDLLRSRAMLEAEILMLRQQINVLRRANPKRLRFASIDRLILGGICRLFPKMYDTLAIVRPDTVIRWQSGGAAGDLNVSQYSSNRHLRVAQSPGMR